MQDIFEVFLLSLAPIGELRLSIPLGLIVYKLDFTLVFLVSVIGNLIPVFFLLFFLRKISDIFCRKINWFNKVFCWWKERAQKKYLEKVQKYGIAGLILFVAIPLPFTGAWTGSLIATLLNLPIKKAFAAITAGVVIAGLIVSCAVLLGINLEKYFGWQVLAIVFLVAVIVYFCYKRIRK